MRVSRSVVIGLVLAWLMGALLALCQREWHDRATQERALRARVEAAVGAIDLPPVPGGAPELRVEAYLAGVVRIALATRFGLSERLHRPGPDEPADREYSLSVVAAEARLARRVQAAGEPLVSLLLMSVPDELTDFGARCITMRLLERVAPARLEPELAKVAREGKYGIAQFEALVSLGRIHDPRGVEPLKDALARLRGWGRQYAIVGLRMLGETKLVGPMMACLSDPEPAVRRHAAMYLAASGDPQGRLAVLQLGQTDPDPTTRLVAQFSLRPIARYPGGDLGLVKDLRTLLEPRERGSSRWGRLDTLEWLQ